MISTDEIKYQLNSVYHFYVRSVKFLEKIVKTEAPDACWKFKLTLDQFYYDETKVGIVTHGVRILFICYWPPIPIKKEEQQAIGEWARKLLDLPKDYEPEREDVDDDKVFFFSKKMTDENGEYWIDLKLVV